MNRVLRCLVLGILFVGVGTMVAWGGFSTTQLTPQTITAGSWGTTGDLVVQAKTLQPNATTQQIHPVMELVNKGTTSVNLSKILIRYWFTDEPLTGDPVFSCFYAVIGCNNVSGSVNYLDPVRQGADYYVQIGFTAGAGTLQAGTSTGPIDVGIQNTLGQSFDQSDDWSFAGLTASLADAPHITASAAGFLVWGQEPVAKAPSTTAHTLYKNNDTNATGNASGEFVIDIVNTGTSALDQSKIKVRYWFTTDGPPATFDASCYSAPLCATASWQPVAPPRTKADMYLQLSLPAGTIRSGDGSGNFHVGFNRIGYSPNIDETNDWSWMSSSANFAQNPNITVYYQGRLIGGTEPT